jgi:thiamine-phosphate pyrophosphorylase
MNRKRALDQQGLYRILDANINRSREGLRVCEEIARFSINSRSISTRLKAVRHEISGLMMRVPSFRRRLLGSRDSEGDVAVDAGIAAEMTRSGGADIFYANIQRSKESLRVLEEFSKLIDPKLSSAFRRLRFRVYSVEKDSLDRIGPLRHT